MPLRSSQRRGYAQTQLEKADQHGPMKTDFADMQLSYKALEHLLATLALARQGDFSARMEAEGDGMEREVADTLNDVLANLERSTTEHERVAEAVSQGELRIRHANDKSAGGFGQLGRSMNAILGVFAKHTSELRRAIKSIHAGDFARLIAIGPDAVHRGGELQRTAEDMNAMIAHIDRVTAEVTRVFAEVGLDGRLNAQCHLSDANGSWALLTGSVNAASASLSEQVQDLCAAAHAIAQGNLAARAALTSRGDLQTLKVDLNSAAEAMSMLCAELRRAALAVADEGRVKLELHHPNPRGDWQSTVDACNRQFAAYAEALSTVTEAAARIERGEAVALDKLLPGELGAPTERLARLAERELRTQRTIEALTEGNFDAVSGDDGPRQVALASLGMRLKRDALSTARVAILEAREQHPRPEAFARAALIAVAQHTGAAIGAYHLAQTDGSFLRVACFGWSAPEPDAAVTPAGSGLIGRVAIERAPLQLDDLDDARVRVRTSLIEIVPRSVLIYPIADDERVVAVIELGFVRPNAAAARELLAFVANDLLRGGVAMNAPVAAERLRAAEEELVITNTRLERVTRELQARDSSLRDVQHDLETLRGLPAVNATADVRPER